MPLPDLIQATCMHRISNEAFVRFRPLPLRFYAIQGYLDSNPISCQCSIYIIIPNKCSAVNHEWENSHDSYIFVLRIRWPDMVYLVCCICSNSPYPEEFNREAVSLVSSYNFAPTPLADEQGSEPLWRRSCQREDSWYSGGKGFLGFSAIDQLWSPISFFDRILLSKSGFLCMFHNPGFWTANFIHAVDQSALYTTSPSTIVARQTAFSISAKSSCIKSRSRTTKLASLPRLIEPILSSSCHI